MINQPRVFVEFASKKFAVSKFAAGTFYANGLIGTNGTVSDATFLIARGLASTRVSVPVEIRHVSGATEFVVSKTDRYLKSVTSSLRWARGYEGFFSSLTPFSPRETQAVNIGRPNLLQNTVYGFAIVVLFTILIVLGLRRSAIEAELAYVSVPGFEFSVTTSGIIEYVKPAGSLKPGEFYAALRSSRGNPIFVEATKQGEIRDASLARGSIVKKGQGLLVLGNGQPAPYAADRKSVV